MNNNKKALIKKWYSEEFLNELKRTAYAEDDGNFNLHSQVCARRRIKIRHRSAHARRTHRQNGKETKACPGFLFLNSIHLKITERSLGFFQKGLRQDFLCKLSYKRRFNQKQTH